MDHNHIQRRMRSLLQLHRSCSLLNEGITKVSLSPQEQDRITQIFFPYIAKKIQEVPPSGRRFAYYTTADTAMKILESKQIWLRNTAVMNDYSEVEYGSECIESAYRAEPGDRLNTALETCFPGMAGELRRIFADWQPIIRHLHHVFVRAFIGRRSTWTPVNVEGLWWRNWCYGSYQWRRHVR